MDALKFVKGWTSEKGAELVEFALTFPLLLLVVLGIIDFGLLLQRVQVLTNAAREGARIAVLPGYTQPDIQTRVNQYLLAVGLPGSATTVVGAAAPVAIGAGKCIEVIPVTVTYTHTYTFVGGILSYFGTSLGTKTLNTTANMRREGGAIPCP
jgi:Flp pilus assembly protein TadG